MVRNCKDKLTKNWHKRELPFGKLSFLAGKNLWTFCFTPSEIMRQNWGSYTIRSPICHDVIFCSNTAMKRLLCFSSDTLDQFSIKIRWNEPYLCCYSVIKHNKQPCWKIMTILTYHLMPCQRISNILRSQPTTLLSCLPPLAMKTSLRHHLILTPFSMHFFILGLSPNALWWWFMSWLIVQDIVTIYASWTKVFEQWLLSSSSLPIPCHMGTTPQSIARWDHPYSFKSYQFTTLWNQMDDCNFFMLFIHVMSWLM